MESPAPSPQGLLPRLSCRNSRRRRRRRRRANPAKPPLLCLRSTSERQRWRRLGEHGAPHLFHQLSSPASTTGFSGAAVGGNQLEYPGVDSSASASWDPLPSLRGPLGGNGTFHQMQMGLRPSPSSYGSQCWEAGEDSGVSPSSPPCLPSPPPTPREKAGKIIKERKLIQEINFF